MKNTSQFILVLFVLFIAPSVYGMEEDHNLDLEFKISELKLEKTQAEVMIIALEKSGRLTADQANDAREEILNSYEENIELLKTRALEKVQNRRSLSSF